jgi:hypothetical protein
MSHPFREAIERAGRVAAEPPLPRHPGPDAGPADQHPVRAPIDLFPLSVTDSFAADQ